MLAATLIGRLGADPTTTTTTSGHTITEARVAFDHGWGDRKVTVWVRVKLWGKRGEALAEHARKGDGVIFTGPAYTETWTGKDGTERTALCLDAQDWRFPPARQSGDRQSNDRPAADRRPARRGDDSDMPF